MLKKLQTVIIALSLLAFVLCLLVRAGDDIPFPTEYRKWAHVKSALVGPQSPAFKTEAGIHHIYANSKAVEGYETGKFPDGSIIVYDLLETKEVSGITIEGPQRRFDMMVKNSQRYKENGGWDFARFRDGSRTDGVIPADIKASCYRCHGQKKDHDFVFSEFRK